MLCTSVNIFGGGKVAERNQSAGINPWSFENLRNVSTNNFRPWDTPKKGSGHVPRGIKIHRATTKISSAKGKAVYTGSAKE